MADAGQLMAMMHPMREPALPDSIVPALVMLGVGCIGAVLVAALVWRARRQASGFRASAQAALAASRGLVPAERLAAQAVLLRRLVRALGEEAGARQHGAAWLASLDRCFKTDFFSKGDGRAYGEALYDPRPFADVEALDRALSGLIARARPVPAARPALARMHKAGA